MRIPKSIFILLLLLLTWCKAFSADSTVNNLVHLPGYTPAAYGVIPEFIKSGSGKKTLILIPGWGFDATVFTDFIKANGTNYTMYVINIPGFGKTHAPAMPDTGTSYGIQHWTKGVEAGIVKLIDKEKLEQPIIAGHFMLGTQLALRVAIDHPEKVGGVITLGGPAKFIPIIKGAAMEFSLKSTIAYVDNNTAPKWFRQMNKQDFDDGNYLPVVYSLNKEIATTLWQQVASVPLPVMIRYLCEFSASDVTLELEKIQCPVLVLRAGYNNEVLHDVLNNYLQPQFIDSWNKAVSKNSRIHLVDIPSSGSFVWKDNPALVYDAIQQFVNNHH
jgi:pimeloyl-ACP methyl ester carboxylesterase